MGHCHLCVYQGLDTGVNAGPVAGTLCWRQLLPWELIHLPPAWSPWIWLCLELPFNPEDLSFRFPLHVPLPFSKPSSFGL